MQISDEQLMMQLAQGNKSCFDELYARYADRLLYFFMKSFAYNQTKAEDMVQDIFIKIIDKPELFNPSFAFKTWLFSIANNMVKNEYRKWSNKHFVEEREAHGTVESDLEKEIDLHHFKSCLKKVLDELSPAHRAAFILKHKEGFSVRQIAELTQELEGTIKSRVHYALKMLQKNLQEFNPNAS